MSLTATYHMLPFKELQNDKFEHFCFWLVEDSGEYQSVEDYGGAGDKSRDILVWRGITELMTSPKLLHQQIRQWIGKKQVKAEDSGETVAQIKLEIEKLKKEEDRYVKAFGAEIISAGQLEEALNNLKSRRAVLERQVGVLESQKKTTDDVFMPSSEQIERFSQKAKVILESLSFAPKQAIIRKVIDTVIATQRQIRVRGYLPIEEIQNVKFQSESGNSWVTKCWQKYAF